MPARITPDRDLPPRETGANQRTSHHSSTQDKIALFQSLFRGREDVFPKRYENQKTGKSGYAAACGNEWIRNICNKPRIKCMDCPHHAFFPVTDEMIRCHLSGKDKQGNNFVAGVYPMLPDETCYFVVLEIDKDTWQDDARAVLMTCRRIDIPASLERTGSGHGVHIWIFFQQAVAATVARKIASHILTETMEKRPELGLASYDRLIPNQDTLPRSSFGTLIPLPLQKTSRDLGNTVFVDDSFAPWPDQWKFLSSIQRIPKDRAHAIASDAEIRGRVTCVRFAYSGDDALPSWNSLPSRRQSNVPLIESMPKSIEIIHGNQLLLEKKHLPPSLRNRLILLAAFQNPEFYCAQAMHLSTHDKPRVIARAEDRPSHICLPRGCLDELLALLKQLKIKPSILDERTHGLPIQATFTGTLRPEQQTAAAAMLAHNTGVLSATTAFGKTVIAAYLIAKRGVNTLILVHRQQLMEQWVERLSLFLDLPSNSIGKLGGGKKMRTGVIDVALVQSLVRKGAVDECVADYGHLIVDECHHISAHSFELVTHCAKARFVCGLSATVMRKDGHHPIIFMQCGPMRHHVDAKQQAEARPFAHHVLVRSTGFRSHNEVDSDSRVAYQRITSELVPCAPRNEMIRDDVVVALHQGRSPLVLTERIEHVEILANLLRPRVSHLILLHGAMGRGSLRLAIESLGTIPKNESRVVIATGKFIGEGFDDPRLDTLFLTMPISWRGIIAQYAGRLHRLHDGKTEVRIHDYADLDVPMLSRMFDRRCAGYEAAGYSILLPASASPGWPAKVTLPIESAWKNDYAASIRRLIRDGVDAPLAKQFAVATQPACDEQRARSAAEAFLFQRLESLTVTTGLFRLNAKLQIPFDSWSEMEVDLFSSYLKLVIEIDGPQHLCDPVAYRRDRRKDALLQENGYHILRFLAEDVSKHLDAVLDAILRSISCLNRGK